MPKSRKPKIVNVPLASISVPRAHSVRAFRGKHVPPALVRSIAKDGIVVPVVLCRRVDRVGKFYVVQGILRLRAARALKLSTIPATIADYRAGTAEAFAAAINANCPPRC